MTHECDGIPCTVVEEALEEDVIHKGCRAIEQRLRVRVGRLEELIYAKDDLLVAYRLQDSKVADRALTRIEKAQVALAEGGTRVIRLGRKKVVAKSDSDASTGR